MTTLAIYTQVDLSSAKQNNIVAGLLKSAMLPLQQVVDGRNIWLNNFKQTNEKFEICQSKYLVFSYLLTFINN